MKKLILILLILLVGCSSNTSSDTSTPSTETISVTDFLGERVEVPKSPKKIAVFDLPVLDTMSLFDTKDIDLISAANAEAFADSFNSFTVAGSLKEPDFEKLNEESPELCVISGRQQSLIEDFKEICATVYVGTNEDSYIEDSKNNALLIGEIFDQKEAVEAYINEFDGKLNTFKEQSPVDGNVLILMVNDGSISAFGPGSRYGWMYNVLNITPTDASIEESTHGMEVNFEFISKTNPDVIFFVDRTKATDSTATTENILVTNSLVMETTAGKNNRIIELPAQEAYLYSGSLKATATIMDTIEAGLSK